MAASSTAVIANTQRMPNPTAIPPPIKGRNRATSFLRGAAADQRVRGGKTTSGAQPYGKALNNEYPVVVDEDLWDTGQRLADQADKQDLPVTDHVAAFAQKCVRHKIRQPVTEKARPASVAICDDDPIKTYTKIAMTGWTAAHQ
jgi:hypothetical protein